jgi:hypothetical protein
MDSVAKMQLSDKTVQIVTSSTIVAVTKASTETCQCKDMDWRLASLFPGGDSEYCLKISRRCRAGSVGRAAMTGPSMAAAEAGLIICPLRPDIDNWVAFTCSDTERYVFSSNSFRVTNAVQERLAPTLSMASAPFKGAVAETTLSQAADARRS